MSRVGLAMHRCLHILEILELICDHLFQRHRGKGSLAALARTCKEIQGPAFDRLWRNQDTLYNIFSCMPCDLFDISDDPDPSGWPRNMRLLRPILATDWHRPLAYTHRVKSLSVSGDCGIGMSDILPAVSASLPFDSLFPNLRELVWLRDEEFLSMRMLLTPTIQTIWLSCEPSHDQLSLLPMLARTCATLKRVTTVSIKMDTDHCRSAMSSFLCMLHSLEHLQAEIPDLKVLQHIGRLATLASLTVNSFPMEIFSMPPVAVASFSALRTLILVIDHIQPATKFLEVYSSLALVQLDVSLATSAPPSALYRFCAALKATCSHKSLMLLTLHSETTHRSPTSAQDEFIFSARSIRTLFCFRILTFISITSPLGFDFDDSTIANMACAWPHLTALLLKSGSQHRPRTTLGCLYPLARHCPHLFRLHITLDASSVPPQDGVVRKRISQQRLVMLCVAQSPISPPTLEVARLISALFPGLIYLSTVRDDDDERPEPDLDDEQQEWRDLWCEVNEHIPVLVAIREEERAITREELAS
ncbi:hypothetical protein FB451DRAFT_1360195 [Mycena latifolia]|nr:hypothetical protein FB451DRAFT_1360195 [Mycena latifolia]